MAELTKQSLFMMHIWHCSSPNHGVSTQCVHADLTQWCVCNPTNVGLGLGFGHISQCIGPWTPRTYIIQVHNGHNIRLWTDQHMLPPNISCQLARLSASARNQWFMTDSVTVMCTSSPICKHILKSVYIYINRPVSNSFIVDKFHSLISQFILMMGKTLLSRLLSSQFQILSGLTMIVINGMCWHNKTYACRS